MAPNVKYTKIGDVHTFETSLPDFEKIVIDQTNVPVDQRSGVAKQMLSCAALSCYTAALAGALDAREANYKSITAEASMEMGSNEVGQGRVKKMHLNVTVEIDENSADIFNRCVKIMRNGCLVTGSLHDGIEMSYNLKADFVK